MKKDDAKKRIEKLKETIDRHRHLYHVLDRQEISEEALDSLKKELFDIETEYPELITPDSPTQRVGGEPLKEFRKTRRSVPMLSLNDAFSKEDLTDWLKRIDKLLPEEEREFFCEYKIDGLAFEAIYEKGVFVSGSTRGDGTVGEDVTENLKTISSLPLRVRAEDNPEFKALIKELRQGRFAVRGEVFISKIDLEKMNKERRSEGLTPFANPRNVAAGSIRQLDPGVAASRNLDSFAYDLVTDLKTETHSRKHELIRSLGFKVNPYSKVCRNIEEVYSFYDDCKEKRQKLPYEIDGIVVMINDNESFERLGVAGKAPRGAIAFKFELKQATTILEGIEVQVGRTGVLTPVAKLKPVNLGGVKVSRATLHNYDEIEEMRLKIGDTVVVGRAGDVIPDIIEVLPEMRTGKEKKVSFPSKCPACKKEIVKERKGSLILRCVNRDCLERIKRRFEHFVSRKVFDISGLGKKVTEKLIDAGKVVDPADIFFLDKDDFLDLEGFAERMAGNAVEAIRSSKRVTTDKLIFSLGIEGVGEETATLLRKNFGDIDGVANSSLEELIAIKDIGEVTAAKIHDWFRDGRNVEFLSKLKKAGIETFDIDPNGPLKGKRFVFTGTLSSGSREEMGRRVSDLGGDVSDSISSNVDYLVIGDDPGSKLKKARSMGIKEIGEDEFMRMIES